MYHQATKKERRLRIHQRIRKKVRGTTERPRLAVFRSLKHIYAQIIDDREGRTLVAAGTIVPGQGGAKKAGAKPAAAYGGNVAAAEKVGAEIAERALGAGIKQVIFDRGGHRYQGRVKALAEAARKAGLEF